MVIGQNSDGSRCFMAPLPQAPLTQVQQPMYLMPPDAGTISINLTDTHAESLTISLNDSSAGVTSTSSTLAFSRNAFVVTSTDSLASDIIAGRTHSLRVTMMKQDTSGTSCSAASDYNVSGVKAWLTCASSDQLARRRI